MHEPVKALFRSVLLEALRNEDAAEWLASDDGQLVCDLADIEPEAIVRMLNEIGTLSGNRK